MSSEQALLQKKWFNADMTKAVRCMKSHAREASKLAAGLTGYRERCHHCGRFYSREIEDSALYCNAYECRRFARLRAS